MKFNYFCYYNNINLYVYINIIMPSDETFENSIQNFYKDYVKFDQAKLLTGIFVNTINSTPVLIPLFSLIEGILFNDSRGVLFFSGNLLNIFINYGIQIFTKSKTQPGFKVVTNSLCIIYNKINTSGMPSLHTQTIGFLAGFLLTMMYIKGNFRILGIMFILALCVIICLLRIKFFSDCNSKSQIIIGLILGILLGCLWAWIVSPGWTPWASDSDIDYSKFNERECDKKNDNEDYECKAYQNGRIVETSN